ncbi:hypothetical protein [Actinoplanes sp. TFC3]|uniref:hypothetical protein n=1 Tax=Actinoplanes sp. TFC3 TaxID=1710355 RepID=UPI000AE99B5F|nr:hypothetical protein [Actinoplanes sp. TFC3]
MNARPGPSALHLQMSKLLISCFVFAIAATGALIVTLIYGFPDKPSGPPPNSVPGMPPGPPPDERPLALLIVLTGLVVLSWLAVLTVSARDRILQRIGGVDADEVRAILTDVRTELAADREREWQKMTERLMEYADQRETDGYLHGMRVATAEESMEANVRPLRRPPSQR